MGVPNTGASWEASKDTEAGPSQWCMAGEQEVVAKSWKKGEIPSSYKHKERKKKKKRIVKITTHWNRLPREAVQSPALEAFKAQLDKHWTTQSEFMVLVYGSCFEQEVGWETS